MKNSFLLAQYYGYTRNQDYFQSNYLSVYKPIYSDQHKRKAFAFGVATSLRFVIADLFFIEQQINIARQQKTNHSMIGDTWLSFPEKTIVYTFVSFGA